MTVAELESGVREANVGLASDFRETINDNFEIIKQFLNEYVQALQKANIVLTGLSTITINQLVISRTSVFQNVLYNNFLSMKDFIMNYYKAISKSSISFLTISASTGKITKFSDEISAQRKEVLTRIIDNGIVTIDFFTANGPILATEFRDKINTNFSKIVDFIKEFDVEIQERVYLQGIHPVPES